MQDGALDWAGGTFWLIIGIWVFALSLLLPFVVWRIKDQMNKLIAINQAMQAQLSAMRKLMQEHKEVGKATNDLLLSSQSESKPKPAAGQPARFHIDEG
jgi:hypothetical protein